MDKIFNIRSLISLAVVIGVVGLVFLLTRSCGGSRLISASVSASEITQGEWITFKDSTSGADYWLWEFGNGDYSEEQSGEYLFPDEGRYQIRLRVDGELEKLFMIRVRPRSSEHRSDHLIRINAPETAIQGEHVLFSAEGADLDWKWEFGESGIIDSREKTAIYAYRDYGTFQVRLTTENTQYPIFHTIEVLPKYMETDSLDAISVASNEIKLRLQQIADGKPFNIHYNYILEKYLCGDPDVLVTVNNTKRNDFYSYCQGLRFTGRANTVIDMVYVESSDPENECIDHIVVLQYDKSAPAAKPQ